MHACGTCPAGINCRQSSHKTETAPLAPCVLRSSGYHQSFIGFLKVKQPNLNPRQEVLDVIAMRYPARMMVRLALMISHPYTCGCIISAAVASQLACTLSHVFLLPDCLMGIPASFLSHLGALMVLR